jgi:FtsZ-binding cell division protein ZapB
MLKSLILLLWSFHSAFAYDGFSLHSSIAERESFKAIASGLEVAIDQAVTRFLSRKGLKSTEPLLTWQQVDKTILSAQGHSLAANAGHLYFFQTTTETENEKLQLITGCGFHYREHIDNEGVVTAAYSFPHCTIVQYGQTAIKNTDAFLGGGKTHTEHPHLLSFSLAFNNATQISPEIRSITWSLGEKGAAGHKEYPARSYFNSLEHLNRYDFKLSFNEQACQTFNNVDIQGSLDYSLLSKKDQTALLLLSGGELQSFIFRIFSSEIEKCLNTKKRERKKFQDEVDHLSEELRLLNLELRNLTQKNEKIVREHRESKVCLSTDLPKIKRRYDSLKNDFQSVKKTRDNLQEDNDHLKSIIKKINHDIDEIDLQMGRFAGSGC